MSDESGKSAPTSTRVCKRCKKQTISGYKCKYCSSVYHPSCARYSNIKFINDDTIICCEEDKGSSVVDLNVLDFNDGNNSVVFKYIIQQKDILIKELYDKIDLLNDKIRLLHDVRVLKEESNTTSDTLKHNGSEGHSLPADVILDAKTNNVFDSENIQEMTVASKYSDVVKTSSSPGKEMCSAECEPSVSNQTENKWITVSHKKKSKALSNVKSDVAVLKKGRNEFITGTSDKNKLATVEKINFLFVSRLDPSMECKDVLEYLNDFKMANYQVEKLKSKYSGYSSFKIGVPISLINEVYSSDFWPKGAFISKFRFPKSSLNSLEEKQIKTT